VPALCSPFTGAESAIFASAIAIAAVQLRALLSWRVMVIAILCVWFFHPPGQKLQIKEIDRLDGRSGHQVHLLERKTEANAKLVPLSAIRKMIDILFNSFTCDAVPGLSPALRDRT